MLASPWASKPTRSEEDLLEEYGAQKEIFLINRIHVRALFEIVKYVHLVDLNYLEDLLEG